MAYPPIPDQLGAAMRVQLTRRLSERIDDVDLSKRRVGDCFDVSDRDAAMLIAEGWASPASPERASQSDGQHTRRLVVKGRRR